MSAHGSVIVGLGRAEGGRPELDWAAREAQLRNRTLTVVRAGQLSHELAPWDTEVEHEIYRQLLALERRRVDEAVAHVRSAWPGVDVQGITPDATPQHALVELSSQAHLLVVGSRGRGAIASLVLGSVSSAVVARAQCPVVVAGHPSPDPAEPRDVVAGVDGSAATQSVLAFAFDYASRHDRPLRVVFCWHPDVLATMDWRPSPPAPERAERWLAEAVAGWRTEYPDVRATVGVLRAHPAEGLVQAAASDELLVVGARSRAPATTMLGSVSQAVLHHATCPVAVVHPAG